MMSDRSAEKAAECFVGWLRYHPASAPVFSRQRQPQLPATPIPGSAMAAAPLLFMLQKGWLEMNCVVCQSPYAGPMEVCMNCLAIVYPHGFPAWIKSNAREKHLVACEMATAPTPALKLQ